MNELAVVCGAGGYVGGRLVQFLKKKGFRVRAVYSPRVVAVHDCVDERIKADLTIPYQAEKSVEGGTWIFNLAANVGGIGYISKNRAQCMSIASINLNLLQACAKHPVAGYFFASSSCVYPSHYEGQVCKEHNGSFACSTAGYGQEKYFSEQACKWFETEHKVPVKIARYHTIYGPGDDRGADRDHFPSAMASKVARAKVSGSNEITIWGDGTQTRSLIHVDDCVEGTFRLMFSNIEGPINLAHPEVVSVNSLVDELETISGTKPVRFYSPEATVGAKNKVACLNRLRTRLGWVPEISMAEGLPSLYRYFYDRYLFAK